MSLERVAKRSAVESCAVKLAKAACPDNIYEQGAYISGFLQATEMIYGWDYEEVGNLVEFDTVQPYSLDPNDVTEIQFGDHRDEHACTRNC